VKSLDGRGLGSRKMAEGKEINLEETNRIKVAHPTLTARITWTYVKQGGGRNRTREPQDKNFGGVVQAKNKAAEI